MTSLYTQLSRRQRRSIVPVLARLLQTRLLLSHASAYRMSVDCSASGCCLADIVEKAGFVLPRQPIVRVEVLPMIFKPLTSRVTHE